MRGFAPMLRSFAVRTAAFLVLLLAGVMAAVNSVEREFMCPFDGMVWKERVETSGTARGLRLDLRQLGEIVDPPTLPQCPKCRFPMFSDRFAGPLVDRLRPFVRGGDFQMLARKNPPYFALAQVQSYLNAPDRHIAMSYLRASWQAEEREGVCRRMLEKAHTHFVAALAVAGQPDAKLDEMSMLCGEIERRLGRWDDAEKRFRAIEESGRLKDSPKAPVIGIQLALIARRDSAPAALDGRAIPPVPSKDETPSLWEAGGVRAPGPLVPLGPGAKPASE